MARHGVERFAMKGDAQHTFEAERLICAEARSHRAHRREAAGPRDSIAAATYKMMSSPYR